MNQWLSNIIKQTEIECHDTILHIEPRLKERKSHTGCSALI
jgi:hypothetical protein